MRLDKYITDKGLCESRTRAEKLILSGKVKIDGEIRQKPSFDIDENAQHSIEIENNEKYVSRGGYKLEGALDKFNVDVNNLEIIDVGASTGGFTDCLLQRGAKHVLALDAGRDQLHSTIRHDKRVNCIEGYNARNISASDVGTFDGAVMDVSFISQTLIIPSLVGVIKDGGFFVSLIKPQFEAGRSALGKGGIVKKEDDRIDAIKKVCLCAHISGLCLMGLTRSSIEGGDGNIEYLAHFKKSSEDRDIQISIDNQNKIKQLCK